MRISLALAAPLFLISLAPLTAQEARDAGPPTYKVEFDFRDAAAPAGQSGRHYTLLIEGSHKAVLKAGSRIPVATSSLGSSNTQYTYIDVGVNIECTVAEMNGKLLMHGTLDLSSVLQSPGPANTSNPPNPTVGQTRLELETTVQPGKPTVIASIDDPATMRKLQVEATVTRVN